MPTITEVVDLPGKFDSWFSGTGLIQGEPISQQSDDPHYNAAAQLVKAAYDASRYIKRGKDGYTLRLTLTGERGLVIDALAYLADYGDYCMVANSDIAFGPYYERDPSAYREYKAGEKVHLKLSARVAELEKELVQS